MSEYSSLDLFDDFTFEDITQARRPEEKGVYVIRIRNQGTDPGEIIAALTPHIAKLRWKIHRL